MSFKNKIIVIAVGVPIMVLATLLSYSFYKKGHHGFVDYGNEGEADVFITQLLDDSKASVVLVTASWAPPFKNNVEDVILKDPHNLRNLYTYAHLDMTEHSQDNGLILHWLGVSTLPAVVFVGPHGNVLREPRFDRWVSKETIVKALKSHVARGTRR